MRLLASMVGWGGALASFAALPLPAQVEPPPATAVRLNGANSETTPSERDGLTVVPASEQQPADDRRTTAMARHNATSVANPLDRFMAAWLSPADFRLLLSKNVMAWPVATGASGALVEARPGSGKVAAATRANPYLAEIPAAPSPIVAAESKPIDHPAKDSSMPTAAAPMPAAVSTGASPPAASPPAARAGEAWKARDDAKYFRQLKRF